MTTRTGWRHIWRWPWAEAAVVISITLVAALLRLYALDRLPPGLYHDEAYNGLDALRILQGETPIFFEANNGREPLYMYILAATMALLGRTPGALRLTSALVGTLTIPTLYYLGRTLFGRQVATLTALLAVASVWMLNLSRVGFRAGTVIPVSALALAALWRGLERRRLGAMALAGALFGLGLYTYLAARFAAVSLFFIILYMAIWHRRALWLRGWVLLALAALLVALPLLHYFVAHWEASMGRAGQVSILNPAIHGGDLGRALWGQVKGALGLFLYRGDFIPRHNVPLRPLLSPLVGGAFLVGAVVLLRRWRTQAQGAICLIWLATMLLPTLLAEGAPHMLRVVGIAPVVYLVPAVGLDALARFWGQRKRALPALALIGLIIGSAWASDVAAYGRHLRSEAVYYNFEAGAAEMAVEINRYLGQGWQGHGLSAAVEASQADRQVWLAPRLWDNWASVRYLCPETPYLRILPQHGSPQPEPTSLDVMLVLWPYEDNARGLSLLPAESLIDVREGAFERGDLEAESRLLYYTVRGQPATSLPGPRDIVWEEGIHLVGAAVRPAAPDEIEVTLYWRAERAIERDLTVFVHLWQGQERLGQHDGPPALGYYKTRQWRPGDVIADRHSVQLAQPYSSDRCRIEIGLYDAHTLERLALVDAQGLATAVTAYTLE